MIYPVWYVVMRSLSGANQTSLNGLFLVPEGFSLNAYRQVVQQAFIFIGYKNSIIVTAGGTLIGLLLTVMTAFPLSRSHLKGKNQIFGMMLFTMVFNGGMIPTYIFIKQLHMIDTLWALILPSALTVFNLLVMIKFFKGIPPELIESAKIDGCNDISILIRIVLPLSQAVIATIALFLAVARWNEYLPGIMYINDESKKVLPVYMFSILTQEGLAGETGMTTTTVTPESLRMAAVFISLLPMLVLYPFLQKYFVKGVMIGAVKG